SGRLCKPERNGSAGLLQRVARHSSRPAGENSGRYFRPTGRCRISERPHGVVHRAPHFSSAAGPCHSHSRRCRRLPRFPPRGDPGGGTVGRPQRAGRARGAGCDHTILYRDVAFVGEVTRLFPDGASAVFGGVGKDTFLPSLDCLEPFGTLVNFGNASGTPPP